jgi:hypothetical protein
MTKGAPTKLKDEPHTGSSNLTPIENPKPGYALTKINHSSRETAKVLVLVTGREILDEQMARKLV